MSGKGKSPETLDVIRSIQQKYDQLSDSHKLVADYVLKNPESATLLTVSELAKQIGTSDATLVRFAREVGFEGYKQMREHLAEYIRRAIYAQKPSLEQPPRTGGVLERVKDLDLAYITRTIEGVDPGRFQRLADEISQAKRVFCLGWRISSFLAEFLAFQLTRLGLNSRPVVRERRSLLEQVLNLKKGDILIVFDLLLYSREVYDAVAYVSTKLKEVKIATFTNDPLAQIVQYSDLPFFLDLSGQRDFSIISLTAPMCLINALVEKIIAQNPQRAQKALSLYEKEVLTKSRYALSPNSKN